MKENPHTNRDETNCNNVRGGGGNSVFGEEWSRAVSVSFYSKVDSPLIFDRRSVDGQ